MRAIKRGGNHQFVSFELLLPQAEAAMYATENIGRNFARVAYTPAATISQRATRRGGEHSLQSHRDRC